MSGQVLLNNVTTKLTAQLLVAGVTANVTAGSGALFAGATGGNYIRATLVRISGFKEVAWEIVYITARSTDALTITRAREGTTALQFEIGDTLEVRMTAKTRDDVTGVWCGTAGGTANALTLTPATPILAYEAGMSFVALSGASANTGAVTFAISGLATIAGQINGAACVAGEIPASTLIRVTLNSATTAQIEVLIPKVVAFRAYATGTTSITSSYNKVVLAGEDYDTASAFDAVTNSRFRPAIAGYYHIMGSVYFASASYMVVVQLRKNGSSVSFGGFEIAARAGKADDIIYLNGSTDYVELYAYSATTQNAVASQSGTYLSGFLIR